jgi:hypothetical protein
MCCLFPGGSSSVPFAVNEVQGWSRWETEVCLAWRDLCLELDGLNSLSLRRQANAVSRES